MDTVTQVALGAAVGEAVMGRRVGRRAALWGGLCGLLPDLDLLVPLTDAVDRLTWHRGPSHSLFVLAAATPLVVRLILRLQPSTSGHRGRWVWLVFLAFATHVLLDCFTVYGTQIFWPLPTPPVMWSSIFIIDPAYSLPLILGVLAALFLHRTPRGHRLNALGLALSSLYLLWSLGAKLHVESRVRASLARQAIPYTALLSSPTAFNTLLWRIVTVNEGTYAEGYHSILDGDRDIRMAHHPANPELLHGLADHRPVRRLQWFTHGFYGVSREGGGIVITDLRMGMEPHYTFRFRVAADIDPLPLPEPARRVRSPRDLRALAWIWQRIWSRPTAQDEKRV